jgi:hypothetical protein
MTAPRQRYPRREKAIGQLTEGQRRHLLLCSTWFGDGFTDRPTFEAAWEMHREDLEDEFRHKRRDETYARPFGWWLTSGHERPIIRRHGDNERSERFHRGTGINAAAFGYLHTQILCVSEGKGLDDWGPWQQPEWEYLEEHNLLTNEEREFLERLDAEPEDA